MIDNSKSWKQLMQHEAFVGKKLRYYAGASASVDDLTQEVWLVALHRLPPFEDPAAVRGWLAQVCRRVAANERRKHRRAAGRELLDELTDAVVPDMPEDQDCLHLAHAISRLSDQQQDVFTLYAASELPMRSVAELIGESEPTAYARYRKALSCLRLDDRLRRRVALEA